MEVRNRFKGLHLIDRVPDELWNEVRDIVQETGIKTIPMEKKCKQAKWLSREALQIAVKRRKVKSKGEKERYTHLNAEFQRRVGRDKKAFLSDQCKETEENNRMGNRFKGLDLIDRVPDELWMEVHDIVQETGIKTIPMEKKCKKAEWPSQLFVNSCENKRSEKQSRKGKI